jgi:hypothetical protein
MTMAKDDQNGTNTNPQARGMLARLTGGPAKVLRAVAGVPAGVSRTRRGTFMVVVIGTLALLAVIAIAHFAIGQTDRRTSASLQRSTRVDDVPRQFADYVSGVLARDLFAVVHEDVNDLIPPSPNDQSDYQQRLVQRREADDRPSLDWRVRSNDQRETLAIGGVDVPNREYFTPWGDGTDPWLADHSPTWLNWDADATPGGTPEYALRRDWGKISVISPDGRFVSLRNLRNNFAAEPGFGRVGGRNRMSEELSLLSWDVNNPDQQAQVTSQTDFGLNTTAGGNAQTAPKYRPAVWGTRQMGAFRAVKERTGVLPSAIGYADNEWVDTDLDGFYDARLFELVDARNSELAKSFLNTDGRIRWFFATRIVDLSGMVNVNTATDLEKKPGPAYLLGLNPGDVDLKRLLTMADAYADWGVGYEGLVQPAGNPATPIAGNYRPYTRSIAFRLGTGAYDAIRWSIQGALVPERYEDVDWQWTGSGVAVGNEGVLRQTNWRGLAGSTAGASAVLSGGNVTEINLPSIFPESDMGSLLARWSVADPRETSRLEAATAARTGTGGRGGPGGLRQLGLDPLRSNRDESVDAERTKRNQNANLVETGQTTREALLHAAIDLRSHLTTMSWSRPIRSMSVNLSLGTKPSTEQLTSERDGQIIVGDFASDDGAASGSDYNSEKSIFGGYVRALAPALRLPGVWPQGSVLPGGGGPDFRARKTLFYGHQGPELALTVAGCMAANFQSMLTDNGRLNNPKTLVFDGNLARDVMDRPEKSPKNAENLPAAPWLKNDSSYCLELAGEGDESDPSLLSMGTNDRLQTPMLHLFGFEPQAFITQVGCYTVWRDTPVGGGGDRDDRSIGFPGGPPANVTINGDLTNDNEDFLFRCVGFQLHNPFNEPVLISDTPTDEARFARTDRFHYLRVKNADQDIEWSTVALFSSNELETDSARTLTGLTLQPGETVVCYFFNQDADELVTRLVDSRFSADEAEARAFLKRWAERQFRPSGAVDVSFRRAIHVMRVNTGVNTPADGWFEDPNDSDAAAIINDPLGTKGTTLQLWRTLRVDTSDYNVAGDNGVVANLVGNDRLMDRFRIPKPDGADPGKSIDKRIAAGNKRIDGCPAGRERGPFSLTQNCNGGLTVLRWATAARPSDPQSGNIPRGGVPAYLLEPQNPPTGTLWHDYTFDDLGEQALPELTSADIEELVADESDQADIQTDVWIDRAEATSYIPSLTSAPSGRTAADGIAAIGSNIAGESFDRIRDLMPRSSRGKKGLTDANNRIFGTALLSADDKSSTLRAADMLLPMAISPWESPLKPNLTAQTNADIRYLTAAEAFAVSYGYENFPAHSADQNLANPLALYSNTPAAANTGDGLGDTQARPVISRGRIVIEDFVPFYDGDANGSFDRARAYDGVNRAQAANRDIRFGLGIPAALGVLDQFNAIETKFGSLLRPVSGRININTAPPNVLRTLPLLTPAKASWGNGLLWNTTWTQLNEEIDLASSILSYRDKGRRGILQGRDQSARFDEDAAENKAFAAVNRVTEQEQLGRARANQMDGIREQPGFLSVGELACAIERDVDDRGLASGTRRGEKRNIDALGFNNPTRDPAGPNNDRDGLNSLMFDQRPRVGPGPATIAVDEVRNDFAERLQVLAALSNVTTVRSDVFACWFVMRGYTQQDVEGLGPDDPMAPSIERRFLMIIDRSNVTQLGKGEPRIVVFKELFPDR